jgi:hypothetical protein
MGVEDGHNRVKRRVVQTVHEQGIHCAHAVEASAMQCNMTTKRTHELPEPDEA